MRSFHVSLFTIILANTFYLQAQTAEILSSQNMPLEVNETSGLALFDDLFLTHNDSGGSPKIYRFTAEGKLVDAITISEQKNTDWEDLAQDDKHLYIANTGNNLGKRKKLRILKVDRSFQAPVQAEVIRIAYANQKDFLPRKKHPFDSEALATMEDQLLLFSKDRLNLRTHIYQVPKQAGDYQLTSDLSFEVQSLITGADYDAASQTLALTAYTFEGMQYLYVAHEVDPQNLRALRFQEYIIPLSPAQIEAVKVIDANHFWVTTEAEGKGFPKLMKLSIEGSIALRTIEAN